METKTISILPTSFDSRNIRYTIQGYKYLTKKIRLCDFEIRNVDSKPIYFGSKGIYQIIKSVSFLNKQGNTIDAMYDTSYMAIKMLSPTNPEQRDINRVLFQNQNLAVDIPSFGQVSSAETQGKQDATKIGGYIDLSFMSNYLLACNISEDFLQINIELADSNVVANGYYLSRSPTLYIDEVLSGEMVDKMDVVLFDTIIPDKIPIYAKNEYREDNIYNFTTAEISSLSQRMNSYTNQLISNMYVYLNTADDLNKGVALQAQETTLNLLIDGRQIFQFQGLSTDARRLAHLTDASGEKCMPCVESFYANISSVPFNLNYSLGLLNPNTDIKYSGNYGFNCVGVNQMVNSEVSILYGAKLYSTDLNKPLFIQALAEVKRYYKKSANMIGNYTIAPTSM